VCPDNFLQSTPAFTRTAPRSPSGPGGIDGNGYAYSGTLLGSSQTWTTPSSHFGPANATNVISAANQTIPLPSGNYSRLQMLAHRRQWQPGLAVICGDLHGCLHDNVSRKD